MDSNKEVYDFTEVLISRLNRDGHTHLSDEMNQGLRGGATSGEILGDLLGTFIEAQQFYPYDNKLQDAIYSIQRALRR